MPHKESKRPYRRVPRFSHYLNHDNLSVPRVFLNFWGTTNMGKTVFLPTWTFSRGPVTPIWNTQKAHLNSQLWCPINFRNWLPRIIVVPHKQSKRHSTRAPRFSLRHANLYKGVCHVFSPIFEVRQIWERWYFYLLECLSGGRSPLYEIHKKLIWTANCGAPSTFEIDCRV